MRRPRARAGRRRYDLHLPAQVARTPLDEAPAFRPGLLSMRGSQVCWVSSSKPDPGGSTPPAPVTFWVCGAAL